MGVVYVVWYVCFVCIRVYMPMFVHAESRGLHGFVQVVNGKNSPWKQKCQFPAQSP